MVLTRGEGVRPIVLFANQGSVIQAAGAAGFVYWIIGFITFLIPGAIVTGQLGLMFPGEGSIYVWTHKALGSFFGFFAGFCAWWPGVLVMVATGDLVMTMLQFLGTTQNQNWLSESWQQGLVVQVGSANRLAFTMDVGELSEALTVVAHSPLIQTENAAISTVIENRAIVELPLNGRNYLQLASLIPGATTNGPSSSQGKQRMGGQRNSFALNVAGQRVRTLRHGMAGEPGLELLAHWKLWWTNWDPKRCRN